MDLDAAEQVCDRVGHALTEAGADSVLFIVTSRDSNGYTQLFYGGVGNNFARQGSAKEYLIREEAKAKADATRRPED